MSRDMTVAPNALVNQAVFAWLRINGYVVPGTVGELASAVSAPPPQVIAPMPVPEVPAPEPSPPSLRVAQEAVVQRITEIEASAAKVVRPQPAWAATPHDEQEDEEEEPVVTGESTIPSMKATAEPADPEGSERTVFLKASPLTLYLEREGHDPIRITQERFVIGRGPQCDLVIDSARVSREHVSLSRKGVTFVLEDLGSSNGTWFNDERISIRELETGDVIVLGNESMTFVVRSE
jgi:hypothetical protein